jgi:endothelin-converting enzyme
MSLKTLARTFSTLRVRVCLVSYLVAWLTDIQDGGWIAAHPLPADKGRFGRFEALATENKRIIQHFLETPSATSSFVTSYDEQLLQKLRAFYSSCLNEDRLDQLGTEPLVRFVKTLQKLFRGEGLEVSAKPDGNDDKLRGLTAAIAFLHSRGEPFAGVPFIY